MVHFPAKGCGARPTFRVLVFPQRQGRRVGIQLTAVLGQRGIVDLFAVVDILQDRNERNALAQREAHRPTHRGPVKRRRVGVAPPERDRKILWSPVRVGAQIDWPLFGLIEFRLSDIGSAPRPNPLVGVEHADPIPIPFPPQSHDVDRGPEEELARAVGPRHLAPQHLAPSQALAIHLQTNVDSWDWFAGDCIHHLGGDG